MASPPYTIATTTPADTDIISIFPGQERPYRDVVWSWLNQIANATTGNLNPSAFPSFVNSWVVQALNASSDATLTYQNSSGVKRFISTWNHTADKQSLITYAVDGVTVKSQLDIIGGAGTAAVNVVTGALQVAGVAVVLPSYSGAISGLTGVGALTSGSIGSGFGSINIGANTLTAGAGTFSGAVSGTSGTFSAGVSGTTGAFSSNVSGVAGTFTSTVTANQNVQSSTAALVLGTTGAGTVYQRPNGVGSVTGQFTVASNGNANSSGDITASSDRRLKKSIAPMNHMWAWDMVAEVEPKSFIRRKSETRSVGFIAQDVEGYAPELVGKDPRGYRTLAYPNMVAILWAVVQDLQKKVTELEAK